jgi:DNA-binding response OmpR family regulator
VIRDLSDPIDLLVTDVVMPDLSGFALAELALREFPHLGVLFISGYTDTDEREWPNSRHFLAKPFRPDQLTAKVRFVLDSGGAAPAGS